MKKATFDTAKNLDLYFRRNRSGTKVLSFFDDSGDPYDLTGINFRVDGAPITLSVLSNKITLVQDVIQPTRDSLFWELVNVTDSKTWLCGLAYYTSGVSDEVDDSVDITIALNGEVVDIMIKSGSSGNVDGGTP